MPLNVKSFYSNKTVKCSFLQDVIEEVKHEDINAADFVITGPSNVGSVTDDEMFSHSGLPGKVSGEIEVVTRSIEQNSNDDEGKDHEEKVVVVMIPQENRKGRIKKPKTEKKKRQSGKRVI